MQVTHPVADLLRIVREIVAHSDECLAVRSRKHGKSTSIGSYPYTAVLILLYRIYIIGAQRIIPRLPSLEPFPLITVSLRSHPHETVTFGTKPYIPVTVFEYGIDDTYIPACPVREPPACLHIRGVTVKFTALGRDPEIVMAVTKHCPDLG